MHTIRILPHGSLMFRDTRPYALGGGAHAHSRDFPYPSVTTGTLRTLVAKQKGVDFGDANAVDEIRTWPVLGPLLRVGGDVYYPSPADLRIQDGRTRAVRPIILGASQGVNLPHQLRPIGNSAISPKSDAPGRFLAASATYDWLMDRPAETAPHADRWCTPSMDSRVRHKTNNSTETSEEGMLYVTDMVSLMVGSSASGIASVERGELLVRAETPVEDSTHRIGGDGGMARFEPCDSNDPWPSALSAELSDLLKNSRLLRMQLATPGIFKGGWCPGWLGPDKTSENEPLRGIPPGAHGDAVLELVGACVPRWEPIGGWDLQRKGPKPLRRLAPAGSVYFFRVVSGNPLDLARKTWLQSVCDDRQDRRDGFGLALWGVWSDRTE